MVLPKERLMIGSVGTAISYHIAFAAKHGEVLNTWNGLCNQCIPMCNHRMSVPGQCNSTRTEKVCVTWVLPDTNAKVT